MRSILQIRRNSNPARIVKYDIKILQSLPTKELFIKYFSIIQSFWKLYANSFLDYFVNTYVNEERNTCISGWQNYIKQKSVSTTDLITFLFLEMDFTT